MATSRAEVIVISSISLITALLWVYKPGPLSMARVFVQGVLSLGLCTLLLHLYTRWRSSRDLAAARARYDSLKLAPGPDCKLMQRREKAQEAYKEQAMSYNERILQPRVEAKQKKKEEEFRRFDGPAWKGASHKLGGCRDGEPEQGQSSRTAAEHRSLPPGPTPPPLPPPKVKMVIVLPPEPAATEPGVVTLELRTPLGRSHRRRFLPDHTIQVALDFMSTVGYHRKLHCLCTSYPRSVVSADPSKSLRQLGILTNTALMVEEIVADEE